MWELNIYNKTENPEKIFLTSWLLTEDTCNSYFSKLSSEMFGNYKEKKLKKFSWIYIEDKILFLEQKILINILVYQSLISFI